MGVEQHRKLSRARFGPPDFVDGGEGVDGLVGCVYVGEDEDAFGGDEVGLGVRGC